MRAVLAALIADSAANSGARLTWTQGDASQSVFAPAPLLTGAVSEQISPRRFCHMTHDRLPFSALQFSSISQWRLRVIWRVRVLGPIFSSSVTWDLDQATIRHVQGLFEEHFTWVTGNTWGGGWGHQVWLSVVVTYFDPRPNDKQNMNEFSYSRAVMSMAHVIMEEKQ